MDQGRDGECLAVLANLRRAPADSTLVQIEYLEIKSQKVFEQRVSENDHPHLQDGSAKSNFLLGVAQYKSLLTNRANLKRTMVAVLTMTFQQWTGVSSCSLACCMHSTDPPLGVNFILYYAPFIFAGLNLAGNTTSLLASGVVGVVMFLATIPTVLYLDSWGRKPVLISGAIMMGICHFVVAGIIGQFKEQWDNNTGSAAATSAGWAAVVFIWLFAIGFGYSWGPT